ncbi:hypothetical protein [Porphyrobacter sp. YT40]|uniref:hypothetical protein n=1 Tax=Porphyrobacter sp. YT40 TaxID=2547601 RepID=UPI001141A6F3|nr:hypothetical protein [Porphyrobacter sp. YT40]QDH35843.1 hypothetical protein E2E27_16880 [Porphyrobacter sp. YT40]
MPLTENRNTPQRSGEIVALSVAANVRIFAGSLVALTAAGLATPGAVATTLKGMGRARGEADNTGGAAGAIKVEVEKGVFRFKNSAAGDAITAADIGSNAFIVDDETVAKTSGGDTRSVAGMIFDVDANGVWIKFS